MIIKNVQLYTEDKYFEDKKLAVLLSGNYYEELGKNLIEKTYNENPMDNLNATLYFGTDNKFLKKYKKVRKELQSSIDSLFSSETEIERYFLDVLSDNARGYQKQ